MEACSHLRLSRSGRCTPTVSDRSDTDSRSAGAGAGNIAECRGSYMAARARPATVRTRSAHRGGWPPRRRGRSGRTASARRLGGAGPAAGSSPTSRWPPPRRTATPPGGQPCSPNPSRPCELTGPRNSRSASPLVRCGRNTTWSSPSPTADRSSASRTGAHGRPSYAKRTCARSDFRTAHGGHAAAHRRRASEGRHGGPRPRTNAYDDGHLQPRDASPGRDAADRMGNALWD